MEPQGGRAQHKGLRFSALVALAFVAVSCPKPGGPSQPRVTPAAVMVPALSAGETYDVAKQAVVRVLCLTIERGTGFLHASGRVITAAHVVKDCTPKDLLVKTADGRVIDIDAIEADETKDLALLRPHVSIGDSGLTVAASSDIAVGAPVTTWGFPAGYNGSTPLLAVGYLAGRDDVKVRGSDEKPQTRWVVNGAFNSGNSGGPVIDIEHQAVIGVVLGKIAPLPRDIEWALETAANERGGLGTTYTFPDGSKQEITQGQMIGVVLKYLRSQTQLVIGYAATLDDLRDFLAENGIEP